MFLLHAFVRRKNSPPKFDAPYVKKPIAKSFAAGSTTSNNSQEDISLDGGKVNSFNNAFRYVFTNEKIFFLVFLLGSDDFNYYWIF